MQNMQKYALPTLLMLQCARPGPRRGGARQEKTVSRLELARHVLFEFLVVNLVELLVAGQTLGQSWRLPSP